MSLCLVLPLSFSQPLPRSSTHSHSVAQHQALQYRDVEWRVADWSGWSGQVLCQGTGQELGWYVVQCSE